MINANAKRRLQMLVMVLHFLNFYFAASFLLSGCDFNLQEHTTTVVEQAPMRLTNDGWPKTHPAWSPDGITIAYSSHQTISRLSKVAPNGENQTIFGSIEDIIEFNDFALSPDGQKLVYYSPRKRGLWLVDFLTKTENLLTPEHPQAFEPVWSPNGNWIVFRARPLDGGFYSIWIIPATGGSARMLSSEETLDSYPVWSPDGNEIAYESSNFVSTTIRVASISDGSIRDLNTELIRSSRPSWSPDGESIVFEAQSNDSTGVWVIPARGGTARKLTTNFRNAYRPLWSPDGATIAFESRSNHSDGIWAIPPQGGEAIHLTKSLLFARDPVWSPDGSQLAFRSANGEIWVVSATGHELQQTAIKSSYPVWFPNSNFLVAVNEIEFSDINLVNTEDLAVRTITNAEEEFSQNIHPDWFPDNDKIIFVRQSGIFFPQIRMLSTTSGESTPLIPNFFYSQYNPEISLDGTKIVFDDGNDIFLSAISDGQPINLTGQIQERLTEPAWSPDGKQLACIGNRSLKIYAIETDHLVQQTKVAGLFSHLSWSSEHPVFGSHLAVEEDNNIYILSLERLNPERNIFGGSYPAWSPDGTKLAYVFRNDIYVLQIFEELPR